MSTRLRASSTIAAPSNRPSIKDVKSVATTQSTTVRPGKTLLPVANRRALGDIGNKASQSTQPGLIRKDSVLGLKRQTGAILKPLETRKPLQVIKPVQVCPPKAPSPVPMDVATGELSNMSIEEQVDAQAFSSAKIQNIDVDDSTNPQLVSEFVNDIYKYMRNLETAQPVAKHYLLSSTTIKPAMRATLVDWLIEVHGRFQLLQETLYLTVAIIDRYLQIELNTSRNQLQLVGVTAMFVASKYEEMYAPEIKDFVYITDKAYSAKEIRRMEVLILAKLQFALGRPLPLHFLRRNTKAASHVNEKVDASHHTLAKYLLELCLPEYEMCHFPPSQVAAAALCLALGILEEDDQLENMWDPTMIHYSDYSLAQLKEPMGNMAAILLKTDSSKCQAVRKKYSSSKMYSISSYPQLKSAFTVRLASQSVIADPKVIQKYAAKLG